MTNRALKNTEELHDEVKTAKSFPDHKVIKYERYFMSLFVKYNAMISMAKIVEAKMIIITNVHKMKMSSPFGLILGSSKPIVPLHVIKWED